MANASEIFETLKKTLTVTADKAAKKTDEIIAVQKVKNKKASLEKQMDGTYRSIGKKIFDAYREGSPLAEDLAKLCEKISTLQEEIEACKEEIADIKGEPIGNSRGPIREEEIEDADFEEADSEEELPEEEAEAEDAVEAAAEETVENVEERKTEE